MQFHPTVLEHAQLKGFLLTEALRGAGATLRNHRGERFMYEYDERLELAPRDIVARAIESEMKRLDTWCVYLDATHLKPEDLQHEFPTIWERLRGVGLKLERDWIPVVPAQHYACGGVATNLHGQTSVPGLYAAGEVARTGVHGANRLASNSLLEALVFAHAVADHVAANPRPLPEMKGEVTPSQTIPEADAIRIRHRLQSLMTRYAGVFRSTAGLQTAAQEIEVLRQEYDSLRGAPFSAYAHEAYNLLVAAGYVVDQALARKENIGLHFNADLEVSSPPGSPGA